MVEAVELLDSRVDLLNIWVDLDWLLRVWTLRTGLCLDWNGHVFFTSADGPRYVSLNNNQLTGGLPSLISSWTMLLYVVSVMSVGGVVELPPRMLLCSMKSFFIVSIAVC